MFDWIEGELACPVCGYPNSEWQTKDLLRMMDVYKIGEEMRIPISPHLNVKAENGHFEIHTSCSNNCNTWIEGIAIVEKGILARLQLQCYELRKKK